MTKGFFDRFRTAAPEKIVAQESEGSKKWQDEFWSKVQEAGASGLLVSGTGKQYDGTQVSKMIAKMQDELNGVLSQSAEERALWLKMLHSASASEYSQWPVAIVNYAINATSSNNTREDFLSLTIRCLQHIKDQETSDSSTTDESVNK